MNAGRYTVTVAYPIQGEKVYTFYAREIAVREFLAMRDDYEFPTILTFPRDIPASDVGGQAQKG